MTKVKHVKMSLGRGTYVIIHIPLMLMEKLGHPSSVSVYENPLRLKLPNIDTNKSLTINKKTAVIAYTPISDVNEYIGNYNYEIQDQTIFLEKIN